MEIAEIREKCVRSMLFMGKASMPRLFNQEPSIMHKEIADVLQDKTIEFVNIIAPRGHAKTTIGAILFTLWHIFCEDLFHGKRPQPKFVLLVSKSRGHTVNILSTIKNILDHNQYFREIFGYFGSQTAMKWREDFIQLSNGSIIVCRGWEQQIRGLNIHGLRPTLIITDDIETEDNTKTPESIESTFRKFTQAVVPARMKPGGRVVNIGTPQVQSSLVFRLEDMDGWRTLRYAAWYTNDSGDRVALWPPVWPLNKLQEWHDSLEKLGRVSSFYREYLCQVIGDSDQLFRDSYLRWWEGDWGHDMNKNAYLTLKGSTENIAVNLFMGVDPASSLTSTADYTCVFVLAIDKDKNIYVIDYLRKRMQPIDVCKAIIEWYNKYLPVKTQVETVAYQSMIADYIKDQGIYIPGLGIKNNPRRGKTERLEGLQPAFATGKVHLRMGHKRTNDCEVFKEELLLFPRAKHDDTLDGYFYAVKGGYPPYHDVILGKPKSARTLVPTYDWMIE